MTVIKYGDTRLVDRFWDKAIPEPNTGCWLWLAYTLPGGYGTYRHNGKVRLAHRTAYSVLYGPIPPGLSLDHLCRTPACVNPDHLEPVTQQENARRGAQGFSLTGMCQSGLHDMTKPENIYSGSSGRRQCRICHGRKAECLICGKILVASKMKRHVRDMHTLERT